MKNIFSPRVSIFTFLRTEKGDTKEEHKSTVCRTNETRTPNIVQGSNDESGMKIEQANVLLKPRKIIHMYLLH